MDGALTGRTLGSGAYRVGQLLGQGAMGAVYEGVQEALGRAVAIKVLHASKGQLRQDQFERFQREAKAAAALGHANIVQITDFQWIGGEPPFLVMERLVGQSLGEAIHRNGKLPAQRVAFISAQVLAALGQAHAAGIVHRDIKPDNVFLTLLAMVSDIVKVLDFGVAKLLDEAPLTMVGAMVGSPAYMPPEQAFGRPVDARSDVYAVGATMYHALSGRPPLDARDAGEFLTKVELPIPALVEVVPAFDRSLSDVVAKAMAKRPEDRFATADAMRIALMPWARPRSPSMAEIQAQVPVRSTGSYPATRSVPPPGPGFSQGSVAPGPGFSQGSVAPGYSQGSVAPGPGFSQGSVAPPAASHGAQASGAYPHVQPAPPSAPAPLVALQGAQQGTRRASSSPALVVVAIAATLALGGAVLALVLFRKAPSSLPDGSLPTATAATTPTPEPSPSVEAPTAPNASLATIMASTSGRPPPIPSVAPIPPASSSPGRAGSAPPHLTGCRATREYSAVAYQANLVLSSQSVQLRVCGDWPCHAG
jgi:serine/threonine protein kinase